MASASEALDLRPKIVMACKTHKCKRCEQPIPIGEDYVRLHVRTDAGWHTEHYHAKCAPMTESS